jgi:hypothetical protein
MVRCDPGSSADLTTIFDATLIDVVNAGAVGHPPRRGARQKVHSGSAETCLHNQAENRAACGKRVGT